MKVTWDAETTTKNKGNPFTRSNKLVSYAVKREEGPTTPHYFDEIEFLAELKAAVEGATLIIGFNYKFDAHWAARHGIRCGPRCRVWDCQVAEFILSGQTNAYPSLDEALSRFSLGKKIDRIAEYWKLGIDTTDIPRDELLEYNVSDVDLTYQLYLKQYEAMTEQQRKLCLVMGLDLLVLQEMEENGHKLNVEKCKAKADESRAEVTAINDELLAMAGTPHINLGSGQQLSFFLYGGNLTVDVPERTEVLTYKSGLKKGQQYEKTYWTTSTHHFPAIFKPKERWKYKNPYQGQDVYAAGDGELKLLAAKSTKQKRLVHLLLRKAELDKLLDYYDGLPNLLIEMEWDDDILHGQYNQVVARTGRLSSSNPNMQNNPLAVDELLVSRY